MGGQYKDIIRWETCNNWIIATFTLGVFIIFYFCVCYVQDMQLALEKAQSTLQERVEQLRSAEEERQRQEEESKRMVRELQTSLLIKKQLIEVRHLNCAK